VTTRSTRRIISSVTCLGLRVGTAIPISRSKSMAAGLVSGPGDVPALSARHPAGAAALKCSRPLRFGRCSRSKQTGLPSSKSREGAASHSLRWESRLPPRTDLSLT
jgi:hypothetical protein